MKECNIKSNYFRIVLMVSMIGGFQEKSFGAPSASKPVQIVFESVPQIHSVAYYVHKSSDVSRAKEIITLTMQAAFDAIAKNIEKQINAGVLFTEVDRKKIN